MFGPLPFLANIGRCPNFLDQALIILHIQPHRDLLYYNKYGLQSPVQFLKGSLSTKNKNQYCFYHPKLCLPTFLTFLTKILTLHCLQLLPKCSSSQHHSLSQLHKRMSLLNKIRNINTNIRSSHQRSSIGKDVFKNLQNSHENTCARASFLIQIPALGLQFY